MSDKKSSGSGRTRNFATVIYPDSAPSDWIEKLTMSFVPSLISPLHDKDLNPDKTIKKPHYHVLLLFQGVKTLEQAKEIFDSIGGVGCEKVTSIRGYARYLCHLDNPDKAQYSPQNVTCLNGADYNNIIGLVTDKYKVISEIIDYCELNSIESYADLLIYCKDSKFEWFRVLCDNGTMVVKEYLKSRTWSNKQFMTRRRPRED